MNRTVLTMVKTGDNIFNALSLVAILLPLVPFAIIFIRRVYNQPILNFLRLLCFFTFLENLFISLPDFTQSATPFITAAFRLGEFTLLFYLLKVTIASTRARYVMTLFLVSYISVIVTMKVLIGVNAYPKSIALIQAFILLGMIAFVLLQLIRDRQIVLFESPVFWIAAGTLCYFGMFVFMELITARPSGLNTQTELEKNMVLSVVDITRFLFYTIAAYVADKKIL